MNKSIIYLMWFAELPFLSLQAQSPGGVARVAENNSTTAASQSMRVVTFKAVRGTERTYYYHRDHLGSSTLITNESGEVVQRVEYLPTGETFIEQQDTSWVSPYKFNGKELDEETGLYYYGARYYDPRLSLWLGTDPMQEKYPGISTYCYTMGNPMIYVELEGRDWEYLNGTKVENHNKIDVYIFYDPNSFSDQSKRMYQNAVARYGEGHVAMSKVTTEKEFIKDWYNMSSQHIKEVNINYHGNNQTIMLDAKHGEYVTATGDGRTNVSGAQATNVQKLPQPLGNISKAQLNLNTCKSNNTTQIRLKGSGKTIMRVFYEQFNFMTIRGTSAGVSYNPFTPPLSHNIFGNIGIIWERGRNLFHTKNLYNHSIIEQEV